MTKDKKDYRILIVEDNAGDYVIVEELLLERIVAPVIRRAHNFKETVVAVNAASESFDVILLDLSLPDKNGQELVDDILLLVGNVPVIILTGYENIDFSIRSISRGICDYLLKDELNASMLYKSILYCIERQRSHLELLTSEKQYSDLFHLSPQPMWVYDMETFRFVEVNESAVDHYGYSQEEFRNMTILDLRSPASGTPQNEPAATDVSETRADHSIHRKKSGELIDVEIYSTPIFINDKNLMSVIAIDTTEKKKYEHRITKAIIKTQEDERYEIGGELHDNVCQILATSKLSLGMLKHSFDPSAMIYYEQATEYISLALEEIRNLSHRLAPAFFDDTTLKDSFEKLIGDFNIDKKYIISFNFNVSLKREQLRHELQLNLYRIMQEQLRNIEKHSGADAIDISITCSNNVLTMTVSDNGVGYDVEKAKNGIGIANMRRRTELFSGKLDITSSPGRGCQVSIDIPL